ncbi:hypothetical protein BS17DRAFT_781415 [Gyrodon lividus]|nr:hypothetical protein BS17DRAFT_781415 [Gyrodon lividus]
MDILLSETRTYTVQAWCDTLIAAAAREPPNAALYVVTSVAFNTNTYSYASSGTTPQPLLHPAIMAYATISERHATLPTALLVDLYHSLGCMVLPSMRLQYVRMDWNTTPSPTRSAPCPGHHRHRAQISSGFPGFSTASVLPNPHTPSFRHHATFSHAQHTTSSRRYFIVTSKNKATR